ncbi:GumC family protein [Mesorhizobium xinjiangense]|uniref:GumC family protein n=1 Tax=Mesorhizobium xinjiangense TaxID=2678685 RepID=UPI0012ED09B5|nr:GNVR domain-containing protein [Mesorhizobium xinjiangense]
MNRQLTSPWFSYLGKTDAVEREFIALSDIILFLRLYMRSIVGCVFVAMLLSWAYVTTTDSTYTATTQILIQPKIPQLLQQQAAEVNLSLDTAQVESQIAVMQSENIAQVVIDELGLTEDPVFTQPRKPTMKDRFTRLKAVVGGWLGSTSAEPGEDPPEVAADGQLTPFERARRTMWLLQGGLDVRRVGVSYAISITFSSPDPDLSAQIANAIASSFIEEQIETKAESARQGGRWLEIRLKELRTQMNEATQIAQEFRARHDYAIDRAGGAEEPGEPTLEELEANAETYRKMYESFLQAYTNSVTQQSYPVADARVLTPATPPLAPSAPRRKLFIAFGMVAGVMFGVGIAFLRSMLDATLRSPDQFGGGLGVECIAQLPPLGRRKGGDAVYDAVIRYPRSGLSEKLREVRTAISLADPSRPVRTLGITSCLPSDGKSFCAANLATLYAQCGVRTMLVDADLEHGVLTSRLAPPSRRYASEFPWKSTSDPDVLASAGGSFDLLVRDGATAKGLVDQKQMKAYLRETHYDMVIVDLPPLTSGGEHLVSAAALDAVLVVVEWGRTPTDMLADLSRTLHAGKANVIGALMTKARFVSTGKSAYRRRGTAC